MAKLGSHLDVYTVVLYQYLFIHDGFKSLYSWHQLYKMKIFALVVK